MYGIETWVAKKQQVSKNRMMDRVRNVEIRVKLKQEGVLEKGKRSQVRQRKALKEMVPERLVRECMNLVQGRRGRGWPRKK